MSVIETNRTNGYLNLNHYFFKILGREYIDLEDLYNNGLIEYEHEGISDKFWILSTSGKKIALYKTDTNSDESYVELLVEEVAHIMDIPSAHYDLAIFDGKKGVISYNFLKDESVDYSGFEVISKFYLMNLENDPDISKLYNIDYINDTVDDACNKLNNLQDIWCILEDRFKDYPDKSKRVKTIMDGLVNKLMLDIVVAAIDSHCDNWKIIDDECSSPVFDNSRSLGMHTRFKRNSIDENRKIQDNQLLFTVDNQPINKPLEVLEYFLKISGSEYRYIFAEKVSKLKDNFSSIPLIVEERTNSTVPDYLKNFFVNDMREYLDRVSTIIENKGTKK